VGDFLPPDQQLGFLATLNEERGGRNVSSSAAGVVGQVGLVEAGNKIGPANIGHKLLEKMGWKEGIGLGAKEQGRTSIVDSGDVKQDRIGLGAGKKQKKKKAEKRGEGERKEQAQEGWEAEEDSEDGDEEADDVYSMYKKRMSLAYKHRPNPMKNPRRTYY